MIDPELEELKKQFIISEEEAELIELRKILDKIYVDRTIKDDRDRVAVLDLTMACLIECERCKELQPHTVKSFGKYVWFYCDDCGMPNNFEIVRNDK